MGQGTSNEQRPESSSADTQSVTVPPSAENAAAAPVSTNAETVDLDQVMKGVELIKTLEAEHKQKLAEVNSLKQKLQDFMQEAEKQRSAKEAERRQELEECEENSKAAYEAKMKSIKAQYEADLEAQVHHVQTKVFSERRLMQQEDALAFVLRELAKEWKAERQKLRASHKQEVDYTKKQIRSTHDKKLKEIIDNFNAEHREIQTQLDHTKAAEKESRKRKSSIWDIFSPSKRSRADSSDEEGDEADDGEDSS